MRSVRQASQTPGLLGKSILNFERKIKFMKQQKVFNKLVRDKIPEIIKNNGGNPEFEILNDESYVESLKEKLFEECKEVINAKTKQEITEELADVMEVMLCIGKIYGIDFEDIEKTRKIKNEKRGSFESRIFLKSSTIAKKF